MTEGNEQYENRGKKRTTFQMKHKKATLCFIRSSAAIFSILACLGRLFINQLGKLTTLYLSKLITHGKKSGEQQKEMRISVGAFCVSYFNVIRI